MKVDDLFIPCKDTKNCKMLNPLYRFKDDWMTVDISKLPNKLEIKNYLVFDNDYSKLYLNVDPYHADKIFLEDRLYFANYDDDKDILFMEALYRYDEIKRDFEIYKQLTDDEKLRLELMK